MDNSEPARPLPAVQACQAASPHRVGLHGHGLAAPADHLDRDHTGAGADVDDQLTRGDPGFGYEALSGPG